MQIEYIDITKLKPYERNAKKHPKNQVKLIANSIKSFGMNDPIAIWGNPPKKRTAKGTKKAATKKTTKK